MTAITESEVRALLAIARDSSNESDLFTAPTIKALCESWLQLRALDAASQPPATDASDVELEAAIIALDVAAFNAGSVEASADEDGNTKESLAAQEALRQLFRRRHGADARLREAAKDVLRLARQDCNIHHWESAVWSLERALAASPPEEAAAGQAEPGFANLALAEQMRRERDTARAERDGLRAKLAAAEARIGDFELASKWRGEDLVKACREIRALEERLASAHPPSSEAREAQIEAFSAKWMSRMRGNGLEFGEEREMHDEAVALMRSAPAAPLQSDTPPSQSSQPRLEHERSGRDGGISSPAAPPLAGTMHVQSTEDRASCGFWPITNCMTNSTDLATCVECLRIEIEHLCRRVLEAKAAPPREDALRELRAWLHEPSLTGMWTAICRDSVIAKIDSLLAKPAAAAQAAGDERKGLVELAQSVYDSAGYDDARMTHRLLVLLIQAVCGGR